MTPTVRTALAHDIRERWATARKNGWDKANKEFILSHKRQIYLITHCANEILVSGRKAWTFCEY